VRRIAVNKIDIRAFGPGASEQSDFDAASGHGGNRAVENQFTAAELRKPLAHKDDPPRVLRLDGIKGVRHVRGAHSEWFCGAIVPRLSLIVIARNEEASIGRCLRSASFADEMVLIDNGSTDKTVEIARSLGATVIETADWPGFGPQKNRALDAATGDWVLSLDADEWIGPALADEIKAAIASPNAANGYEMPRRSRFCGTVVGHCGWWPDYVTRLWLRGKGRFADVPVHERVIVEGKVARLKEPIDHDAIADVADAHDKAARYAKAAAAEMARQGKRSSQAKAMVRAAGAFLRTFVWRSGFLDGATGWRVARYNTDYTFQKWARLAELNAQNK
jgi:glycosyltransferase involved in cell wall biosynthesis